MENTQYEGKQQVWSPSTYVYIATELSLYPFPLNKGTYQTSKESVLQIPKRH